MGPHARTEASVQIESIVINASVQLDMKEAHVKQTLTTVKTVLVYTDNVWMVLRNMFVTAIIRGSKASTARHQLLQQRRQLHQRLRLVHRPQQHRPQQPRQHRRQQPPQNRRQHLRQQQS
eukprot:gb/GEZN01002122.1/.p3 GENE.gb/GEZN01002122.1/~~gb/GEZN01002122.1/.p3  ORF type:complete len:120 (+),score=3.07 gb/GEZN01002122.1/:1121-1480(+)